MRSKIKEKIKKLDLPKRVLMKILLVMATLKEEELVHLDKILDEYEMKNKKIKGQHLKKIISINENYLQMIEGLKKEAFSHYEKETALAEKQIADDLINTI